MPFVPSIASPVDDAAIYMAWLVVNVFLPLLMLLSLFNFCHCLLPLSIINTPHIHISKVSSSSSTTTAAPRRRMLLDDGRCRGIVVCAPAATVVIGAWASKGRPMMPRHRCPSRCRCHHLCERKPRHCFPRQHCRHRHHHCAGERGTTIVM